MANSLYGQPFNGLIADPSPPAVWESKDKLVISLDFGTTFSGISYCFTKQKDAKIVAITNWPGAAGQAVPKIPTMISYDLKDKNAFTWGASVKRTADCVVGVKLLLDPSQDLPQYLPAEYTQQDLTKLPKKPVEIAADYIRSIYQHALAEIKKEIPESYMQMCQKHFVMSVPAVWSDAAKNATEQAARIAGIYPVTLIKEPEAAALYTIDSLKFSLSDNDTFVVCDAGGGTVDLISYEVAGHDPVLQLRELVPGTGGMAGSLGLNRRFAEAVKNLVGQKVWESFRKTKAFIHAEKTFETEVKRDFQGDIDEEYYISFPMGALPDNPKARLQSNLWEMTGKDVKEIFEPIVLHILKLIDEQVAAVKIKKPGQKLTGIFLVGGFGSSNYLLKRVEARFPGIKVLQPTDAWAAIVKGATLSNLPREASIISTCATRHYGVEAWSTYDPEADGDVPTRKWYDGTTKAETMTWYIKIGDDLFREDKIRFPFYRVLPENYTPENLIFTDILYDCQTPEAPRNRCKGKVNSNCTLVTDLRNLPKTHFKQEKNYMNETQYLLHYHIVVSVKTALMTFSLEIDGKPMNLVGVNFK